MGSSVRRRLPPHPSSAGEARRLVRHLLTGAGRDDLVEPAQLLVSEVVTNALVHSGTAIDVSMAMSDDGVLVEVGDGSRHLPARRHYAATASTGRGLALLEETAAAWGVVPGVHGKTVWFQVTSADDTGGDAGDDAGDDAGGNTTADATNGYDVAASPEAEPAGCPSRPETRTVPVELLNMPLLLHAAWQQHIEAMLREYLLACLDEAPWDPLHVHACATDALAVLAEHIPRPDVAVEPDELMSSAVDAVVSSTRVHVPVPATSVSHFATLDEALVEAVAMGDRGHLLAPPVQPEMRALRRWLCTEVQQQSRGEAPVPWPPPDEHGLPPRRELDWDAAAVTDSTDAVLAADDTDRVVAASDAVLELLGYERGELVGERLVAIIPHRYRQAHLAGFTLYQLTGRGPLLGTTVRVPALRRDGTEVAVELGVAVRQVPHGHAVFVATLRPAHP